jgi:hypothetical protein
MFSKLLCKRGGIMQKRVASSVLDMPLERKKSSLGKRVFSGLHESTFGNFLTSLKILSSGKP